MISKDWIERKTDELLARVGVGIEIEPKYVAVTLERLSDMGLEPRLEKS